VIHSLGTTALGSQNVVSVVLLGSEDQIQSHQAPDGLHIQLPAQPPGKYAYAFRVVLGKTPQ
jgi:alpha-L-fucosidase